MVSVVQLCLKIERCCGQFASGDEQMARIYKLVQLMLSLRVYGAACRMAADHRLALTEAAFPIPVKGKKKYGAFTGRLNAAPRLMGWSAEISMHIRANRSSYKTAGQECGANLGFDGNAAFPRCWCAARLKKANLLECRTRMSRPPLSHFRHFSHTIGPGFVDR
jgi:hypothetical protein